MPEPDAQSNLFATPAPGSNLPEYGVSEISKLLKKTVEDTFGLVRVRGEISECKLHSSGHLYITLKDEGAILSSVCWRGQVSKLAIKPVLGMEVICTGRLTTYAGQSKYQMVIEGMALAGMGALLKMLEDRKLRLASEGLFDASRKQELPFLPGVIGVVTSPTGAVIRDILHRLEDRFPRRVMVWPVAVQGPGAAEQIAAAIEGFNALPEGGNIPRPDVLIVARGGGSVEDLMPFNEEIVVRAAAASHIALISAVGHETDTTLIDYAADIRAPTPTAAAEMAVPVRAQLLAQVMEKGTRLLQSARRILQDRRERLSLTERALGDPARVIEPLAQRLDERVERLHMAWDSGRERRQGNVKEAFVKLPSPLDLFKLREQEAQEKFGRLDRAGKTFLERRQSNLAETAARLQSPQSYLNLGAERLANFDKRKKTAWRENCRRWENQLRLLGAELKHLSHKAVLERGYALVKDEQGRLVTSHKQFRNGDLLRIEFHDGGNTAIIKED
ncbi:MAG: exodeoxyribonuclease VII large subunit [Pseudomonadota bacterium]|nr:exodeoxyribonuclease VII large subunit [Pseudomonadota bacterium]